MPPFQESLITKTPKEPRDSFGHAETIAFGWTPRAFSYFEKKCWDSLSFTRSRACIVESFYETFGEWLISTHPRHWKRCEQPA
jgi:hypothetical protein